LLTFLCTSAVEKEQPDAKTRRFRPTRGKVLIY